ncbi:3-phosphoshikimate 1-carboxyvinyltransferase [Glaciecola punicea ACAM 611]|uniref:3-phosphoshikimate 1-carboxyvinyltransferase n=1 Tax=Glaciecola punicea ACAM 611 TaxID=1121923 RepID=H5T9S4_9ALTE|nr:3-phosphoshikimate 1-carboxyvinyltransferase [Glaciecola punicea]GAB55051.1 3-phosphoshikimate 1-carboxyvinyltransferase [Glaciecola punicea ACAM 611]
MEQLTLSPVKKVSGHIHLPGSKSLSNRALLLAALSEGQTRLYNLLDSDDIRHMLNALKALGVEFTLSNNNTECVVQGIAGKFSRHSQLSLFLGNAGTAMRPLCAALAFSDVDVILTGEPRMEERPIGDLANELIRAGANISYLKNEGYPPVAIKSAQIDQDTFEIDGSVSSQFLTALLMAAPLLAGSVASNKVTIHIKGTLVSKPYIDITLDCMAKFGVVVHNQNYQTFTISGQHQYIAPAYFLVEGDASSASYFLAAGAIKGGEIKVSGIGRASVQGDIGFADVLEKMGATVVWEDDSITVSKGPKALLAVDMDMNHIPDAAMTIATTALFAKGTTAIRNIHNWRVKETDRLFAMATELRKVGAVVTEGDDFIEITPPAVIEHASIDTYDDHRIAMCFSLVALDDKCGVTINNPKCTAKTFPDYFLQYAKVCER